MTNILALKTEREIAEYVIEQIEELIPGIEIIKTYPEYRNEKFRIDLLMDVRIGDRRKKLVCEIKSVGEPRYLFQAVAQLKYTSKMIENSYPVIIAPTISERGQEICRENEIGYLDLTGNISLRFNGVYIERTGKGKPKKGKDKLKNIFSPVSSRILRALLEKPKRGWTLIELHMESGASLGYVHKVVQSLKDQGYLQEKRRVQLKDPGRLLDDWASGYNFSANKMHAFYSFEKEPVKMMRKIEDISKKIDIEYAMTMHAGASLVAPFVRYTDVHFYIRGQLERWIKELDLRPVEFGGTIHLIEPYDNGIFYRTQNIEDTKIVSNIQLYLDLYNYPARGREQAEFLRENKIGF